MMCRTCLLLVFLSLWLACPMPATSGLQQVEETKKERASPTPFFPTQLEDSLYNLRGGTKVAAVLLTFNPPYDEAVGTVEKTLANVFTKGIGDNNGASANSFFKDASYQRFWFVGHNDPAGDVFGPVALPFTTGSESCAYADWAEKAEELLGSTFDPANYDFIFYYFSGPCKSRGRPEWSPRSAMIGGLAIRATGHEGGHALGWNHASSYGCVDDSGGQVAGVSDNCSFVEYGDPFEVMGIQGQEPPNMQKRGLLGWLEPSNTQTAMEGGAFHISFMEPATAAVQVLRIPRMVTATSVEQFLYVDVRQDIPADDPGVMLRLAPPYNQSGRSYLLDMHPDPGTMTFTEEMFEDAPLSVGETFTDPITGISVNLETIDTSGATVVVEVGTPLICVRTPPTGAFVPNTNSGLAGNAVTFTYEISNNDVNCPAAVLAGTYQLPDEWTLLPPTAKIDLTLQPGQTASGEVKIVSPVGASEGNYDVKVNLTDNRAGIATAFTGSYVVIEE